LSKLLNQDEHLEIKKPEELVDTKTIDLVNKHFKEAKAYREQFEEEWRECEDFYNGKHWKDKNRSFKNLVFPLVEQEVATLMDSLPSTDLLARNPEREFDAKMLEGSVHFTYEQQSLSIKTEMLIRSMLKTGTGLIYVDYDPDAENGQGIATIKNIPWEHVYLDPAASELDEAGFVGFKFPVRVTEAKRRYPKFADQIKASMSEGSYGSDSRGLHEDRANYSRGGTNSEDKYKLEGMCEIEEAWLKDYTMEQVPEDESLAEIKKETEQFFKGEIPDIGRFEDHPAHISAHEAQLRTIAGEALGLDPAVITEADIEGLKEDPELGPIVLFIQDHIRIHTEYQKINPKGERPKYENFLRLVIKIGNVIVYDGNPPVNDGMVPLVIGYCYKDEKSIWGVGEVKHVLPAQKSFNEMDNAEYESLHLTHNGGWVMDSNCGIDPSTVTNKRGKVYVINPGTRFERLQPGQTSPQLSQRKLSDQQFTQVISGMNEASQGRPAGGVTAARAIERLQQATNGRIRLKSGSFALYTMPRLGKLVASRNAKYWTTERFMRVTDNSTGQVQIVKYDPEQVRDLDYDVRVVQSSLAGTDKEAQAEVMAAYVDKGWLPPKVYFQIVDVPNKKKVLEALEQNDQQLQLMQQLQAENEQLKAMIQQSNNGAPVEQSMPTQTAPQE
jgi:hypothetical protein